MYFMQISFVGFYALPRVLPHVITTVVVSYTCTSYMLPSLYYTFPMSANHILPGTTQQIKHTSYIMQYLEKLKQYKQIQCQYAGTDQSGVHRTYILLRGVLLFVVVVLQYVLHFLECFSLLPYTLIQFTYERYFLAVHP